MLYWFSEISWKTNLLGFIKNKGNLDNNGKVVPLTVRPGDIVVLPEYGGAKINLKDGEFFVYRDTDIIGTLQKDWLIVSLYPYDLHVYVHFE